MKLKLSMHMNLDSKPSYLNSAYEDPKQASRQSLGVYGVHYAVIHTAEYDDTRVQNT